MTLGTLLHVQITKFSFQAVAVSSTIVFKRVVPCLKIGTKIALARLFLITRPGVFKT